MDEQYQVSGAHTELESVRFHIGFPVLQADRWTYGHMTTIISRIER